MSTHSRRHCCTPAKSGLAPYRIPVGRGAFRPLLVAAVRRHSGSSGTDRPVSAGDAMDRPQRSRQRGPLCRPCLAALSTRFATPFLPGSLSLASTGRLPGLSISLVRRTRPRTSCRRSFAPTPVTASLAPSQPPVAGARRFPPQNPDNKPWDAYGASQRPGVVVRRLNRLMTADLPEVAGSLATLTARDANPRLPLPASRPASTKAPHRYSYMEAKILKGSIKPQPRLLADPGLPVSRR